MSPPSASSPARAPDPWPQYGRALGSLVSLTAASLSTASLAIVLPAIALMGCSDDSSHSGSSTTVPSPCDEISASGEATYYDFADGSGNCSFPATPNDLLVGAMNHTDYAGSAVCGACVRVSGPDGSVDVRIVDRCPECPQGDIDLSPQAFEQIAALELGRVPITWNYVPCALSGSIRYHFKDGSNPWWTAVQVRNHRHAIARFEVLLDGAYVDVPRLDYNFFVKSDGMGEGPYTFRVTDVTGEVLEDSGVPLLDNDGWDGSGQFPACQ